MSRLNTKNLVYTAACVVLAVILPTAFHALGLGREFLPMYPAVILCALICGPYWGILCAVLSVLLSATFTGMPQLYPMGIAMIADLAAYTFISGYLYRIRSLNIYLSIAVGLAVGRIINGIILALLTGGSQIDFGFAAFANGTLLSALPGIIIQIAAVPVIVFALQKSGVVVKPRAGKA